MADNTNFSTFPSNAYEAMAMLYMQNQNLVGLSPEAIYDRYHDAYKKIREHAREKRKEDNLNKSSIRI